MATWSNVHTLTSPGLYFDCDDVNGIYYTRNISGNFHVFKYNVSTDTETQLSNDASWTGYFTYTFESFPVYFKGNLYIVVQEFPGTIVAVYRYSGSGTAWTQVMSVVRPIADSAFTHFLSRTTDHLVFIAILPTGVAVQGVIPTTIRYSSDGSSWSTGSEDGLPTPPDASAYGGYNVASVVGYNPNSSNTGFFIQLRQQVGATDFKTLHRILKWTGTSFQTLFYYRNDIDNPPFTGELWLKSRYLLYDILHWLLSPSQYAAILTGSWLTPTGVSGVSPSLSVGFFTKSTGYDTSGSNLLFHVMDTVRIWEAGETVLSGTGSKIFLSVIRFTGSGDVYIAAQQATNFGIYARSEPIVDAPSSAARLWMYKFDGAEWSSRGVKT